MVLVVAVTQRHWEAARWRFVGGSVARQLWLCGGYGFKVKGCYGGSIGGGNGGWWVVLGGGSGIAAARRRHGGRGGETGKEEEGEGGVVGAWWWLAKCPGWWRRLGEGGAVVMWWLGVKEERVQRGFGGVGLVMRKG
ncbi:uncharacterized protein LOC107620739 [Arachis ipaensis]|uniref:uncharacterized protein LOC107620739 n=1 Tax=Arachis ipaensis TaxID=130454 RepID=UPI0007AF2648|nr:uncharacterized protein LOC107620739 [Arachis ipaensis]